MLQLIRNRLKGIDLIMYHVNLELKLVRTTRKLSNYFTLLMTLLIYEGLKPK